MFYAFTHTVTTSDTENDKHRLEMKLAAGVIHQVDVLFEDGCNHAAEVQVFRGAVQLWPSNRGATMKGNATVISFREFLELQVGSSELIAFVWGDGEINNCDVIVQIGLLPKKVLQPLSFEELLAAAMGFEE